MDFRRYSSNIASIEEEDEVSEDHSGCEESSSGSGSRQLSPFDGVSYTRSEMSSDSEDIENFIDKIKDGSRKDEDLQLSREGSGQKKQAELIEEIKNMVLEDDSFPDAEDVPKEDQQNPLPDETLENEKGGEPELDDQKRDCNSKLVSRCEELLIPEGPNAEDSPDKIQEKFSDSQSPSGGDVIGTDSEKAQTSLAKESKSSSEDHDSKNDSEDSEKSSEGHAKDFEGPESSSDGHSEDSEGRSCSNEDHAKNFEGPVSSSEGHMKDSEGLKTSNEGHSKDFKGLENSSEGHSEDSEELKHSNGDHANDLEDLESSSGDHSKDSEELKNANGGHANSFEGPESSSEDRSEDFEHPGNSTEGHMKDSEELQNSNEGHAKDFEGIEKSIEGHSKDLKSPNSNEVHVKASGGTEDSEDTQNSIKGLFKASADPENDKKEHPGASVDPEVDGRGCSEDPKDHVDTKEPEDLNECREDACGAKKCIPGGPKNSLGDLLESPSKFHMETVLSLANAEENDKLTKTDMLQELKKDLSKDSVPEKMTEDLQEKVGKSLEDPPSVGPVVSNSTNLRLAESQKKQVTPMGFGKQVSRKSDSLKDQRPRSLNQDQRGHRSQKGKQLARSRLKTRPSFETDMTQEVKTAADVRKLVFVTWYSDRQTKAEKKAQLEKNRRLLEESGKQQEKKEQQHIAKISFDKWQKEKKELEAKARKKNLLLKKKDKRKLKEKLEQKSEAIKVYESWKKNKDQLIKKSAKRPKCTDEAKEERKKAAEVTFIAWRENIEKQLKEEGIKARNKVRLKSQQDRMKKEERDREALDAYRLWLKHKHPFLSWN